MASVIKRLLGRKSPKRSPAKSPRRSPAKSPNKNNNVFYNAASSLNNMIRMGYRTMPRQPLPTNAVLRKLYMSVKK